MGMLAFCWTHAKFGVELYDEPFYLVSGFKWFAAGDRAFEHEAHNGPRQYDLFNHLLIRPFVDFSVLELRRAALLVYALILLGFTVTCFCGSIGFSALLVYCVCLGFDYFQLPTWSHNWWVRNLILLHHSFLWGAISQTGIKKDLLLVLAGVSVGAAGVAYHPVALGVVAYFVVFALFRRSVREFLPYVFAVLAVWIIDAIYLLQPKVFPFWIEALKVVREDYFSAGKITPEKLRGIVRAILLSREVWLLTIFAGSWVSRKGTYALLGLVMAFLIFRWNSLQYAFIPLQMYVALGIVGATCLAVKEGGKNSLSLWMPLSTLAVAFSMAAASHNGFYALFWALPASIVPFVCWRTRQLDGSLRMKLSHSILLLWLAWIAVGSLRQMDQQTYGDAPAKRCTAEIRALPYNGIYTTSARASLIESLSWITHGKFSVLAIGIPAVYLFPGVHSPVDSTIIDPQLSPKIALKALAKLKKSHRSLQLIVLAKQSYDGQHPWMTFAECVRGAMVHDREEIVAFKVNGARIETCIDSTLKKSARSGTNQAQWGGKWPLIKFAELAEQI